MSSTTPNTPSPEAIAEKVVALLEPKLDRMIDQKLDQRFAAFEGQLLIKVERTVRRVVTETMTSHFTHSAA